MDKITSDDVQVSFDTKPSFSVSERKRKHKICHQEKSNKKASYTDTRVYDLIELSRKNYLKSKDGKCLQKTKYFARPGKTYVKHFRIENSYSSILTYISKW